ncbi:MAG TPA: hypothetical protein VG939_05385 [Caulobacteraceae bacterium]|nr:hypothetical protein [Caulobacteraceae bacterium]
MSPPWIKPTNWEHVLAELPAGLSMRQLHVIDGLRYACAMAEIAYARLWRHLQALAASFDDRSEGDMRPIAQAMLDAWSIVDHAARFQTLLPQLQGLPRVEKGLWIRQLDSFLVGIEDLRNGVQHITNNREGVLPERQIWGTLIWCKVSPEGQNFGATFAAVPGISKEGDQIFFLGGPARPAPPGAVQLEAWGHRVSLGRITLALGGAAARLDALVRAGGLTGIGEAAPTIKGRDWLTQGTMYLLVETTAPGQQGTPPERLDEILRAEGGIRIPVDGEQDRTP